MTEPNNKEIAEAYEFLHRMTGAEPYASTVLPMARELCAVRKAERERLLKLVHVALLDGGMGQEDAQALVLTVFLRLRSAP